MDQSEGQYPPCPHQVGCFGPDLSEDPIVPLVRPIPKIDFIKQEVNDAAEIGSNHQDNEPLPAVPEAKDHLSPHVSSFVDIVVVPKPEVSKLTIQLDGWA